MTGITTFNLYSVTIFHETGDDIDGAQNSTAIFGITRFIFNFIAFYFIDSIEIWIILNCILEIGRKPLFIGGSIVITVTLFLMAASHSNLEVFLTASLFYSAGIATSYTPLW